MSHELRTPLNSIIGFSRILLKSKAGNLRPVDLVHLERITANGTHLLGVSNGVLDLSKIEAGRVDLDLESVDVAALVQETLEQMESQAQILEVSLATDIPALLAHFITDHARFKQVIINLVGNAMKFTRGGSVTVRVVSDANSVLDVMMPGKGGLDALARSSAILSFARSGS
ncbi:hypothetical protein BH09GEM1_BH09GEM1_27630 [soil metagenome]